MKSVIFKEYVLKIALLSKNLKIEYTKLFFKLKTPFDIAYKKTKQPLMKNLLIKAFSVAKHYWDDDHIFKFLKFLCLENLKTLKN